MARAIRAPPPVTGVTHTARGVVGVEKDSTHNSPSWKPVPASSAPAQLRPVLGLSLQAVQSGGGGVNGHPQLLGQGGQTGDVVGVLVGDQHRAEPGGIGPSAFRAEVIRRAEMPASSKT